MEKPGVKPNNPNFSSGPCTKRPGWSSEAISKALLGRSHRSGEAKARLKEVIDNHKAILGIPEDYKVGIVPASDTGAMEMAMWSILGARPVDVFAWESFSGDWLTDVMEHMKPEGARGFDADYGQIPDLSQADPAHDIVFPWNGTTSGVRVPNVDWISETREGLTICDATSGIFAHDMPWEKLDVTTWSWQKGIGGEAAHGMLVLSPRAVERLETYTADRPLPKLFRMTKQGKLNEGIFKGVTINTPSMMAVEDCLDALAWVESIGGVQETIARAQSNYEALQNWVETTDWVEFLTKDPEIRSVTSGCLIISDEWFQSKDKDAQTEVINELYQMVEDEGAGYDFKSYRTAPPGLRIWCGPTVETSDIEALLPWIEWAYESVKAKQQQQAA